MPFCRSLIRLLPVVWTLVIFAPAFCFGSVENEPSINPVKPIGTLDDSPENKPEDKLDEKVVRRLSHFEPAPSSDAAIYSFPAKYSPPAINRLLLQEFANFLHLENYSAAHDGAAHDSLANSSPSHVFNFEGMTPSNEIAKISIRFPGADGSPAALKIWLNAREKDSKYPGRNFYFDLVSNLSQIEIGNDSQLLARFLDIDGHMPADIFDRYFKSAPASKAVKIFYLITYPRLKMPLLLKKIFARRVKISVAGGTRFEFRFRTPFRSAKCLMALEGLAASPTAQKAAL